MKPAICRGRTILDLATVLSQQVKNYKRKIYSVQSEYVQPFSICNKMFRSWKRKRIIFRQTRISYKLLAKCETFRQICFIFLKIIYVEVDRTQAIVCRGLEKLSRFRDYQNALKKIYLTKEK